MKSDRLVVLMSPEEKARLAAVARARHLSIGELVRTAIASLDAPPSAERTDAEKLAGDPSSLILEAHEAAALERLAGVALKTLGRANAALDEAFEEIGATKTYFAAKRTAAGDGS